MRFSELSQSLEDTNDNGQSYLELTKAIEDRILSGVKKKGTGAVNLTALMTFVALLLIATAAIMILYISATVLAISAAVSIHKKLVKSVMNAPFWLYDFLPIGAILNRFSADTEVVDNGPIFSMSYFFGSCTNVVVTVSSVGVWLSQ